MAARKKRNRRRNRGRFAPLVRLLFFVALGAAHYCETLRDWYSYDQLVETIRCNGAETDEFAAGGFTLARAKSIHAPVIEEAFLTLECTLEQVQDLSGAGITAMVVGRVGSSLWAKSLRARWFSSNSSFTGLAAVISLERPHTAMQGWL